VFTQDGNTVVSGGLDGTVRLWDVTTAQERATLQGHGGMVGSLGFSADGKSLVSLGHDWTVRLWETSGEQ
jgi:WD40 repeat protein